MPSLFKVSIMTHMDINFCILLFYIFLRNVMAFDKELALLYGFSNSRISKKTTLLEKKPQWDPKHYFFNFCLILNQNAYNFVQNCQNCIYFWSHPNISLKIKKFDHFSVFLMISPLSHVE